MAQLPQRVKTDGTFEWHAVKGKGPCYATQVLVATLPGGKPPMRVKWALIKDDDTHVVLINFTILPKDADEIAAFDRAADEMAGSIAHLKESTATTRSGGEPR